MTTPLPGWYQDPAHPGEQRWWDGREWSTYTLPLADGTDPVPAEPGSGEHASSEERPGESEPRETGIPHGDQQEDPAMKTRPDFTRTHAPLPSYPEPGQPQGYPAYQQDNPAYQPAGQGYHGGSSGEPPSGYPGYQGYTGYPGYPGYQGFPGYPPPARRTNALALTGFILGFVAMFFFWIPFLGTLIALSAGAFSAIGLSNQGPDHAPAYKVFGIIGLIFGILFTVITVLLLALIFSSVGAASMY